MMFMMVFDCLSNNQFLLQSPQCGKCHHSIKLDMSTTSSSMHLCAFFMLIFILEYHQWLFISYPHYIGMGIINYNLIKERWSVPNARIYDISNVGIPLPIICTLSYTHMIFSFYNLMVVHLSQSCFKQSSSSNLLLYNEQCLTLSFAQIVDTCICWMDCTVHILSLLYASLWCSEFGTHSIIGQYSMSWYTQVAGIIINYTCCYYKCGFQYIQLYTFVTQFLTVVQICILHDCFVCS
jgi:hypothetical protein